MKNHHGRPRPAGAGARAGVVAAVLVVACLIGGTSTAATAAPTHQGNHRRGTVAGYRVRRVGPRVRSDHRQAADHRVAGDHPGTRDAATTSTAAPTTSTTPGTGDVEGTGYQVQSAVPSRQRVSVIVALPLRNAAALQSLLDNQLTPGSPQYRHWLTPAQFQSDYGVQPQTVSTLARSLGGDHLTVSPFGAQAVTVSGRASDVDAAFSAKLATVRRRDGRVALASLRPMSGPEPIQGVGGVVVDLSPVPRTTTTAREVPLNRYSSTGAYWGDDLKQAYGYPAYGPPDQTEADGAGVTIGTVMASATSVRDDDRYFADEKLAAPAITVEPVLGGSRFDAKSGQSLEADLDVQQAGATAPDADIIEYDLPDLSDQSVFAGYTQVVEDNAVDVVSGSFSACELYYTAAYNGGTNLTGILRAEDDLFMQADSQGITTVFSSGDDGSLGCTTPDYFASGATKARFIPGVGFPASSPHVIAVGGTDLVTAHAKRSLNSSYVSENAVGDPLGPYDPDGVGKDVSGGYWGSGGGISSVFPAPRFQRAIGVGGGRSVPDIALHMGGCPGGIARSCQGCPNIESTPACIPQDSSDVEIFAGRPIGVIGTSASAPDFAGTVALMDQVAGGRVGDIDPELYALGAEQRAGRLPYQLFREDIPGFSGHYSTAYTKSGDSTGGFDQVIGNGTLIAKNLVFSSGATPAAGIPETPSNP